MSVLSVVCFVVALIFLGVSVFLGLRASPGPQPWDHLSVRLGLLFFVLAEFFARGGLPS